MNTPIGELLLLADESGSLRAVEWADHEERLHRLLSRQYRSTQITIERRNNPFGLTSTLEIYFAGDMESIQSLSIATGGTPFQRRVWESLRSIPAGETTSYGNLARKLDAAAAVRAVGLANGANLISIVVPCHRVIGANGSLTGYGGGLHRKQWLLEHEQKYTSVAGMPSVFAVKPTDIRKTSPVERNRSNALELPFPDETQPCETKASF